MIFTRVTLPPTFIQRQLESARAWAQSPKLTRRLPTKGGGTLRTVLDTPICMPALSKDREPRAQ
jgi:hypothetical protein